MTKTAPAIPISSDQTSNPDDELVERDEKGNYKILGPSAAMRMSIEKPTTPEEEEKEQEDNMIALYGRGHCHWDQAGKSPVSFFSRENLRLRVGRRNRKGRCA